MAASVREIDEQCLPRHMLRITQKAPGSVYLMAYQLHGVRILAASIPLGRRTEVWQSWNWKCCIIPCDPRRRQTLILVSCVAVVGKSLFTLAVDTVQHHQASFQLGYNHVRRIIQRRSIGPGVTLVTLYIPSMQTLRVSSRFSYIGASLHRYYSARAHSLIALFSSPRTARL